MTQTLDVFVLRANAHTRCLYTLAQTISLTLQDLGYQSIMREIYTHDLPRARNGGVLLGAHLDARAVLPHADKWIIYNTEQQGSGWFTDEYNALLQSAKGVWDYSAENAITRPYSKVVPPGSHARYLRPAHTPTDPLIDIFFAGSPHPRRTKILDQLRMTGLVVVDTFGIYGEPLYHLINNSKLCLNMHYYDTGIFEAVRVQELLLQGAAVLSESSAQDEGAHWPITIHPYDELVARAQTIISSGAWLQGRMQARNWNTTMHRHILAALESV